MTVREVEDRITNRAIHNLSQRPLAPLEVKALGLGLKFIPTPCALFGQQVSRAVSAFTRRVRIAYKFRDTSDPLPPFFIPNPGYEPPAACARTEFYIHEVEQKVNALKDKITARHPSNMDRFSVTALRRLAKDATVVIKPADKNLGVVILSREWYVAEAMRQLSDADVYQRVDEVPMSALFSRLHAWCMRWGHLFHKKTRAFILQQREGGGVGRPASEGFRVCRFYLLPKIHKEPVMGRPICSSVGWLFEHASKVLDHHLQPLLAHVNTHLSDSLSLLHTLSGVSIPPHAIFLTYDVQSLYPSIPTDLGLSAVRTMLETHGDGHMCEALVELLTLVMTENHLQFGDGFWKQVRGTAMGTPVAVIYAVLFMGWLDSLMTSQLSHLSPHIILHKRYIDDGVVIWGGERPDLEAWIAAFNNLIPSINLSWEMSDTSFTLLDITFSKGERWTRDGVLDTCVYQKPLNKYLYIPWSSAHPSHCMRGLILGELRRYILRESSVVGFIRIRNAFYTRLRARGYPASFLRRVFKELDYNMRPRLLDESLVARGERRGQKGESVLPFVLDYHPSVEHSHVGAAIQFPSIFSPYLEQVLAKKPILSLRSAPNLAKWLVRATLSPCNSQQQQGEE